MNKYHLIIDTSSSKTLVAYGASDQVAIIREWTAGFQLSRELLPAIEKLLARRGRPAAIFCVTGPGSFTGLRIAVSTAYALGYAWNIPVIPIEAFEIYEANQKNPMPPYTVVLDNIKDLVYVKRVRRGEKQYAVANIVEGKRQKAKGKSEEFFGYIPKEKQIISGVKNKRLLASPLSGRQRAKLISQIGQGRLKGSCNFTKPIVPLYVNSPNITLKK